MKLRSIALQGKPDKKEYPFIPLIRNITSFHFDGQVTFIVGENGSGKSTFLDLVAGLTGASRIGDLRKSALETEDISPFMLVSSGRNIRPFYFKAEDFVLYLDYLREVRRSSREEIDRIDQMDRTPYSKSLMKLPHQSSLHGVDALYDQDIIMRSHGERFLDFFQGRLRSDNLYLLDEPEVPLSVTNQLVLMSRIREALNRNCQFIIATHSPVLLAYPGAAIYLIEDDAFKRTTYEELESVSLMRAFLNRPATFMKEMFREQDQDAKDSREGERDDEHE
jgi:predicted ATPase